MVPLRMDWPAWSCLNCFSWQQKIVNVISICTSVLQAVLSMPEWAFMIRCACCLARLPRLVLAIQPALVRFCYWQATKENAMPCHILGFISTSLYRVG